ncbi:beta-glucosidase BglX [Arenibacter sp. GZD96]|uniref:beta-glucosidase BglX n=1 Tax=Aurantibrevibacter litoralis TaxID=3106030 RepID=UPI002AFDE413|nr:beta-glucosidase BglX [Arenibacter sp. GZD-96]MEA1784519.1 beta-glucosidase BglX [Arenibacter sp. GZD-96]
MKYPLYLYVSFICCSAFGQSVITTEKNTMGSINQKVDSLLKVMTLQEKIGQMNQYNGFWNVTGPVPVEGDAATKYAHLKTGMVGSMLNVRGADEVRKVQKIAVEETRLGIPLIIGFDLIHGYKTISPIPLAEAASWDMEAIRKSAEMAAAEAAASGINWTFAPMIDISRDARWGRVMEGAGEDPFLGSKIAYARVKGFQGDDLAATHTIAATVKHFAGYGFSESGRDYNTVDVGTSTLYNIIFPPVMAAIDADVKTVMNSFNDLNGIPATGNAFLQREVLKKEWNYQGFVVSDWGSIREMIPHGFAKDAKEAGLLAVNAGSDMDMESYIYVHHLEALVHEGKVAIEHIDDAVKRILKVKYELGLFDDPYSYCDTSREKEIVGSAEHTAMVLDMAKKSIVLLQNERQILPLKKEGLHIALIGDLADDKNSPLGSWRIAAEDDSAVSVLEGLQRYPKNKVTYARGVALTVGETNFITETKINTTDRTGIREAVEAAKDKDVVLMVLGEHGFQTGEARSRVSLDLPGLQQELLEAVYAVNKNIVLILMNGRPLAIPWAAANIPAILETWHLGSQSGNAIAEVLYGDYNPSGKLPMTFPRHVGQVPIYYNHKATGRPTNPGNDIVFWSHYMDESNEPLYPFGHGLGYSSFVYSNLQLSASSFQIDQKLEVTFSIKNTGKFAGREVAQLYIRDLVGSSTRPVKELKDFAIIELQPGESKKVTFTIDQKTIQFYTAQNKWEAEPGDFKVFVGGSSATTLEANFALEP